MKIKVGLDIGGSTTKIVGMQEGKIIARAIVKAADPVTSAFGAVGKLINDNSISVNDIEQINITGVGSGFPQAPILGIRTVAVEEFKATGLGGLYLSGLDHAVVCQAHYRFRRRRRHACRLRSGSGRYIRCRQTL